MVRKRTTIKIVGILLVVTSMFCAGCKTNKILSNDKEKCGIAVSDRFTITYQNNEYVMLSEQISKEMVGAWVGYVNKNISGAMFSTVYLDKTNEDMINVAVDDSFYRAVKKEKMKEEQAIMQVVDEGLFDSGEDTIPKELTVNPNNATQLIAEDKVYQVTDEKISRERLEGYITSISEYVVFDSDTKKILEREEYVKIDWDGTKGEENNRTIWVYTDVYRVMDSNMDSIGVKINGMYYIAMLLDE
ncbi:MAG: NisI/SpaI family lantibiotic immunity lipoprotein [Agathobacter sp.]|nr:NisI/SpaI family lantibiotic immunity lipoprotein [Agathobacter sp.]